MMDAVERALHEEMGVPLIKIHSERYNMVWPLREDPLATQVRDDVGPLERRPHRRRLRGRMTPGVSPAH